MGDFDRLLVITVNWDTQAGRNTTVSLRCQGPVALYFLTPAMADGEGERGL